MPTQPARPTTAANVDDLINRADQGVAADVVLRALDPVLETRLEQLLDQFGTCQPELGALLDLRAKIAEVWRMKKELRMLAGKGKTASEALGRILDTLAIKTK